MSIKYLVTIILLCLFAFACIPEGYVSYGNVLECSDSYDQNETAVLEKTEFSKEPKKNYVILLRWQFFIEALVKNIFHPPR